MKNKSTRVQLSLRFDEYPELLEQVKKYCKLKGLTITHFVVNAFENALEVGVSELSDKTPINQKIEALQTQLKILLSEREEASQNLKAAQRQIDNLGDSFNKNVPKLNNSVWCLEGVVFNKQQSLVARLTKIESDISQLQKGITVPTDDLLKPDEVFTSQGEKSPKVDYQHLADKIVHSYPLQKRKEVTKILSKFIDALPKD